MNFFIATLKDFIRIKTFLLIVTIPSFLIIYYVKKSFIRGN